MSAKVKSGQPWTIVLAKRPICAERFLIDLQRHLIFFDFDAFFTWRQPASQENFAAGYCSPGGTYFGYTPCQSRFFYSTEDGNRFLDRETFAKVFEKIGAFPILDKAAEDERIRAAQDKYATYLAEFERAATLEDVASFERRYEVVDKDGLIPKLQPLKARLLHQRYVSAFANAKSEAELNKFIETYSANDPDALIPKARQRILLAQARAKEQQKKDAAAKLVAAQVARQKEAQARVANCKRLTADAYAALDRERSIEAVSGVENLYAKRQAGEIIVACQRIIGRGY